MEALTPVDVLRRAGLPVKTVSVTNRNSSVGTPHMSGSAAPGEGDFFSKDGYAYQKERKRTLHTCRKFLGIL